MAVLKCKMCGGDLQATDNTYGTCTFCGSTMTLPKAEDEQKVNLFNRANNLRRLNEFDKAVAAYENILNLDSSSAEAHWGLVLSKFGIEYVEEPNTHERIPTCHRVHSESILVDSDYLAAIENAPDAYTKSLYEEEAKRISDIQKGILAISSKEEPYDVFICYKETTEGGSRTKDSALAQDLYYQLEKEGFKVFFSRISLEKKLGQQYEPYIFNALNSAKVMLVIGTKPEYFNALWVKNEWSRFLALMKKDKSKLLIPCYRDMDAYDLPEEMAMLQSQDMGRIGFAQDILHGIKKVAGKQDVSTTQPSITSAQSTASTANIDNLLNRVRLFLEDGDWKQANDYCERILDLDSENARAYMGKLCAELNFKSEAELINCKEFLDNMSNYQKAIRFADKDYAVVLTQINEELKQNIIESQYQTLVGWLDDLSNNYYVAYDEQSHDMRLSELAIRFRTMNGYKNTDILAQECDEKATQLKQEYQIAEKKRKFEEEERKREQEERERLEQERRKLREKIEHEHRAEQERQEQAKRERREAKERERWRIEEEERKAIKTRWIVGRVITFLFAIISTFLMYRSFVIEGSVGIILGTIIIILNVLSFAFQFFAGRNIVALIGGIIWSILCFWSASAHIGMCCYGGCVDCKQDNLYATYLIFSSISILIANIMAFIFPSDSP
jgi:hypothetical protein